MRNFVIGFLWFILCLTCFCGWSQPIPASSKAVAEQIYIHFDKPFYTTGETIWYQVYFLNPDTSALQSQIIYADLINKKGEVVLQQKLKREQRSTSGSLTIPFDLSEGYYQFRCYTRWNLNFGKKGVFYRNLPIYNAWEESTVASAETKPVLSQANTLAKPQKQNLLITLKTDKAVYLNDEKVTLQIEVTDADQHPVAASLSMSVVDADLVHYRDDLKSNEWEDSPIEPLLSQEIKFTPEKTLNLNGKILDPTTLRPITSQFLSIYFTEDQSFMNTSIANGQLQLDIPDFYGSQIVQIHNHNPFQDAVPEVKIQQTATFVPEADMPASLPERTPVVLQYLQMSRLRRKIDDIFYTSHANSGSVNKETISPFKPDKTYLMEDYQLLKNVEEFIEQVFTKVRISEKNGKKTVRLFNPLTQKFMEDSPWYMVNGYLTRQEEAILAMPVKDMRKLDLFLYQNTIIKQFPQLMIRNGVIAIYTQDKKIPLELINDRNSFTLQGFSLQKDFVVPIDSENAKDKIPDFRPLIYWKPDIMTDEHGKARISFPNSKAISQFLIHVEGISIEGKIGSNSVTYQVQFAEN